MDTILIILGLLLVLVGIIGCIVPGLPGPMSGWSGLLALTYAKIIPDNWQMIGFTFVIAVGVSILDYFIPAIGTKKFGGSKYGTYGAMIGLLIGIITPIPGGILIGPFVGAFVGEYLKNKNSEQATKAAMGAFIGFLVSTGMQLIVAIAFLVMYFNIIINNWSAIQGLYTH